MQDPLDYIGSTYERGHIAANADRDRNLKDQLATYLMSNMQPQKDSSNNGPWKGLEVEARRLVKQEGKELYVIGGGYGSIPNTKLNDNGITVPERLWKVIVVLEEGQSIIDVSESNRIIAVDMPNNATGDWTQYISTRGDIESAVKRTIPNFRLLSNLQKNTRQNSGLSASLRVGAQDLPESTKVGIGAYFNTSIRHNGIAIETHVDHLNFIEATSQEIGTFKVGSPKVSEGEVGLRQISSSEINHSQPSSTQISSAQIGSAQIGWPTRTSEEISITQIGSTQVDIDQLGIAKVGFRQIDATQFDIPQPNSFQLNASKVSFPSSIAIQQFLSSHNFNLQDTTIPTWVSLLQTPNPFNLNFIVKDLPTGQLAETQIIRFDTQGRPIAGTILIDDDANGTGWFIDPTPWDSSEFSLHNTEYNFQATPDSIAYGRYDLLTTILHEIGHLTGFIAGHQHFDGHVHNHTFTDGDLTAALTVDGSHLTDPLRLMSPYLTPGMRKLPSELELRILQAIRNHDGTTHAHGPLSAAQTAILTGITNGDFAQLLDQWNHRGTVQTSAFNTSTAVTLTEDSPILSQLSQTFVIPQDASQRYLTFDLLETTLSSTTHRPPDAFEVALLDATTLKPLVGTALGLTNTDALLNLQSNGTLYLDDDVTVTALSNGHRRVRIDLGDLATGLTNTPTTATLYFDLLGFGAADSRITIDNITFGKGSTPPVATDDTATLTQGQSTPLTLLTNDTADEPLTPSQLTLATNPTHGSLTRDEQGNLIYTPFNGYAGSDSFTYRLTNSDGETSNLATVNLEILNAAPQIQTIALPNTATEGTSLSFTAEATDPGNDTLTYTWTFSDGSPSLTGQTIAHTFTDNGDYTVTLTVRDEDGGTTTQTMYGLVDCPQRWPYSSCRKLVGHGDGVCQCGGAIASFTSLVKAYSRSGEYGRNGAGNARPTGSLPSPSCRDRGPSFSASSASSMTQYCQRAFVLDADAHRKLPSLFGHSLHLYSQTFSY